MGYAGRPRHRQIGLTGGQMAIDGDFTDVPATEENKIQSTGDLSYPELPEGHNTKYIQVIIETHKIAQSADPNNVDSLYDCLNRYIQMCRDYDVKLTNMGAYQACGLTRYTVDRWASGKVRTSNPEYMQFAQTIRAVCSEYREILMAEGKIHPVTGIWWQKNYDSFSDQPSIAPESFDSKDDTVTSDEIKEKYANLPDE
jgi:hypothetical protein